MLLLLLVLGGAATAVWAVHIVQRCMQKCASPHSTNVFRWCDVGRLAAAAAAAHSGHVCLE
jgi:hypothetical protein